MQKSKMAVWEALEIAVKRREAKRKGVGLFSFGGFFGGVTVITVSEVKSLFSTPWTVAYQAPLSMGFSRQKYWSGLPFPSSEDVPDPGIKPRSPAL